MILLILYNLVKNFFHLRLGSLGKPYFPLGVHKTSPSPIITALIHYKMLSILVRLSTGIDS